MLESLFYFQVVFLFKLCLLDKIKKEHGYWIFFKRRVHLKLNIQLITPRPVCLWLSTTYPSKELGHFNYLKNTK